MYSKATADLLKDVRMWFLDNGLDYAIVGYSGGIDSATTAAVLHHAGINTTVFQTCFKGQKLSSPMIAMYFVAALNDFHDSGSYVTRWDYLEMELPRYLSDEGKEAALPIIRNAYFYGIAAEHRCNGFNPVVVGTANFDEAAYLGFWGKASDAAQDFYPISHLHKSEVYALAKELGVPQEIIDAVPSGDLQWSGELNDHKMIGATYPQIERVANEAIKVGSNGDLTKLINAILSVDDPETFVMDNIRRNRHKYVLPFPGIHVYGRLEQFRKYAYRNIINAVCEVEDLVKGMPAFRKN
jgi:NAD+ synthetase